jgi:NhaP-type Na+/H+ and K+/H+ antiporter
MQEGFLLGVIVASSLAAAAFFLKFWRKTRDRLFLGFAAAIGIKKGNP